MCQLISCCFRHLARHPAVRCFSEGSCEVGHFLAEQRALQTGDDAYLALGVLQRWVLCVNHFFGQFDHILKLTTALGPSPQSAEPMLTFPRFGRRHVRGTLAVHLGLWHQIGPVIKPPAAAKVCVDMISAVDLVDTVSGLWL